MRIPLRAVGTLAATCLAGAGCGPVTDHGQVVLPVEHEILFVGSMAPVFGVALFTMRGDGSNVVRIAPGWRCMRGSWSPDGEHVVYANDPGYFCSQGRSTIAVVRADGTDYRALTPVFENVTGFWETYPAWSLDGELIAVARSCDEQITAPDPVPDAWRAVVILPECMAAAYTS